jgi:hypothetical protein
MKLENLKKENDNYKTVNIEGTLYLINDTCDELGYHFADNIIISTYDVEKKLDETYQTLKKLNIKYILNIIPDKTCILSDKLEFFFNKKCKRIHVESLKNKEYVIDSYDSIKNNNIKSYRNLDSHLSSFGIYLAYCDVMKKIGLNYKNYEKLDYYKEMGGDLLSPINNGNREHNNLIMENIPIIKFENYKFTNIHIKIYLLMIYLAKQTLLIKHILIQRKPKLCGILIQN